MQVFGKMDILTSFSNMVKNGQNSQNRDLRFYMCMWCGVKKGVRQMARFRPFLASYFYMGKPRENRNPRQTPMKKRYGCFFQNGQYAQKVQKWAFLTPPQKSPILHRFSYARLFLRSILDPQKVHITTGCYVTFWGIRNGTIWNSRLYGTPSPFFSEDAIYKNFPNGNFL